MLTSLLQLGSSRASRLPQMKNLCLSLILAAFSAHGAEPVTTNTPERHLDELSFYLDHEWVEKTPRKADGSIYRARLAKERELGGIVSINRSWDSDEIDGPLRPFLTGVAGWDPLEQKIVFLDFSRDGMMVRGTIELLDENTVVYEFEFTPPGLKRRFVGRDVLEFDQDREEFVWTTYFVRPGQAEYTEIDRTVMVRR